MSTIVLNIVIPSDAFAAPEPTPVVAQFADNSVRVTDEQRKALFASYNKVFGSARNGARYIFTNLILGNEPSTQVSWSTWKPGALTMLEAAFLLKSLRSLEAAL